MAFSALVMFGVAACSGDSVSAETANTTTTTTNDGTSDDPTTEATTIDDTSESGMVDTETDTNDGPTDTDTGPGSFYAGPEPDFSSDCDPIFQDCPDGEKCVPYGSNGGTWDANKCVPIFGDGEPGDPCTYAGVIEATDDCDGSSLCWNVVEVDGALVGACAPFCAPPHSDPQCADGSTCLIANGGSVTVCVETCDPLAQDCPDGQGCYLFSNQFVCLVDLSDPQGLPCDFIAQCPAGSECVTAAQVPDCDGTGCCAPYCSLANPMCDPGTECVALFNGNPPPGYDDVGLCLLP